MVLIIYTTKSQPARHNKRYKNKKENINNKMSNGVIICLGKILRKDGTPEPMLLSRCDKALEVYGKTGYPIINSGADTIGCGRSEARVMTEYMNRRYPGVPIIMDEAANNTVENFQNCLQFADAIGATKIVIVTCQHHMPRAEYVCRAVLIARGQEIALETAPSSDPVENRAQLRVEEYKKIFTTPKYLQKHFGLEPPGEVQFKATKSKLACLLRPCDRRRKSVSYLQSLHFDTITARS